MRIVSSLRIASALAFATLLSGPARAQCVDWTPGYHLAGISGTVDALVVFDDGSGSGPELYVGGQFQVAGGVAASNIAKWNGTRWAPVGAGRPSPVHALCVWNDGNGAALYAGLDRAEAYVPPGGALTTIAKWNGVAWTGLPGGIDLGFGEVESMAVHDDGTGAALYVGGYFHNNSPVWPRVPSIARFDGTAWSPVGNGFVNMTVQGVTALISHDDGSGPRLYAGGHALRTVAGPTYGGVASFDGAQWQLASTGIDAGVFVNAFAVLGGNLHTAGTSTLGSSGNFLMRRSGGAWGAVGGSIIGTANALLTVARPGGEVLYGSGFSTVGGVTVNGIASWNGVVWQGLGGTNAYISGPMAMYDEGAGPALFARGNVVVPGAPDATGIARYENGAWSGVGGGEDYNPRPNRGLVSYDDGQGATLYAGSNFGVLRRAGHQWVPLGNLARPVTALHVHDDGVHGLSLYAAFQPSNQTIPQFVRWDGAAWSPLGTGLSFANPNWYPSVYDMTSFVHGGVSLLVVVGDFDRAGGQVAPFAAAWDGTAWVSLGAGLNHIVLDVEVFDDGSGPTLFVGGVFYDVPGGSHGIARWNGSSWGSAGVGAPASNALHVHDSGSGPRLYASRRAAAPGGSAGLSVYDGSTWSTVVAGISPGALSSYDDGSGSGPQLIACGGFTTIGGVQANGIASFDGQQWHPLGSGFAQGTGSGASLAVHDDGNGPALFVIGGFEFAGGYASYAFARYGPTGAPGCVSTTGSVTCAGDGGGAACPCGNTGGADRGCGNSANANGAVLVAEGQAHRSSDNVTLRASGMTPGGAALFFQGTQSIAGGAGVAFGDGVRCVSGTQVRLAIRSVSGGVASFGDAVPGDASVSSAGLLPLGASTRDYQVWYRDAQSFCTTSTFNLTNGLRLRWAP